MQQFFNFSVQVGLFLVVQIQNLGQILDPVLVGLRYCSVLYKILLLRLQSLVALLRQRTKLSKTDRRSLLVVLVPETLVRIPSLNKGRGFFSSRRLVL